MDNLLSIKGPILLVGIGGAGSKIAVQTSSVLQCKCLLISNDARDLKGSDETIFVDTEKWINPTAYKLRHFAQMMAQDIKSALKGFQTVIVISNLAGRAGNAIAPLICKLAESAVISVAIMPFGYEKDRIFQSGVSLRRIRDTSDATIVMDNDALLNNNPDLSVEECHRISNLSISEVLASLRSTVIDSDTNLLCTGRSSSAESSLRDSIAMLYGNISGKNSVKRAMLHVMGGNKVSVGAINELAQHVQSVFSEDQVAEVSVSLSDEGGDGRVHLLANVQSATRFDGYDPLAGIIPKENALDWEEMDSAPEIQLSTLSDLE